MRSLRCSSQHGRQAQLGGAQRQQAAWQQREAGQCQPHGCTASGPLANHSPASNEQVWPQAAATVLPPAHVQAAATPASENPNSRCQGISAYTSVNMAESGGLGSFCAAARACTVSLQDCRAGRVRKLGVSRVQRALVETVNAPPPAPAYLSPARRR